jgi:UDP-GlcNAc:undecaprenyl-phosphate/decaprenyl-phosphate GlcNAc-1-phosphate transferase
MIYHPMLLAPIVALLLGLVIVRAIRWAAPLIGFVDSPDRRRKLHEAPIALGGGIAVWIATWCGWWISLTALPAGVAGAADSFWFFAPLAVASFLVLALGVVDDRYGMRGCHKLVGQVLVAVIMVFSGLRIDALSGFGIVIELGAFGSLITIFWIVLVVNAFNLIDGMDGFCGGVAFVISIALAFMAFCSGRMGDALIGLALAGALAAFLKDNLPPARIYLGDAGSMTLGMMFSALSIRACAGGPGSPISLPPLLALLTLPLLDVATALGRRWLTGHSLFMPDRGHIHHRLRIRLGGTLAATGVAVGLVAFGACGAALAGAWGLGDGVAVLAIVTPVVALVATETFGSSELRLLIFRLKRASTRFLDRGSAQAGTIRQECRLHGGRDWAVVWDALIRSAEVGDVRQIEMAIDMPAAGETYHGLWSLSTAAEVVPHWSVVHSIHVRGVHAGELRVSGSIDTSRARYLDKVEELVRILEGHLEADESHPQIHTPSGLTSQGLGSVILPGTEV